ncbi:hypothetical protein D3Z60_12630 [Lachnospiraceae bacterium]|nr:hypothetical protein [Lachnospiraceae bacterium]
MSKKNWLKDRLDEGLVILSSRKKMGFLSGHGRQAGMHRMPAERSICMETASGIHRENKETMKVVKKCVIFIFVGLLA